MAYVADTYAGGHIAATDLQNIEGNFEFLRTNFKGGGSPADPGGGLEGVFWWGSTNKLPKVRDDSGWRGVFSGGASFKIWAYLDSVPDGWTRDTGVTDVVLSLKGGSVYTTGATVPVASSWTISGLSSANESVHTHTGPSHVHSLLGTVIIADRTIATPGEEIAYDESRDDWYLDTTSYSISSNNDVSKLSGPNTISGGTDATGAGSDHNHTVSQDGDWRIKAATGILIYPKM